MCGFQRGERCGSLLLRPPHARQKDDVSFVVTKLDEERSIAVGIITRIIRQNL